MPKALVLFGSGSDEHVFKKLEKELKEKKIKYNLRVLSAHKTPNELEKTVNESKADLFICGAGLSAALPGVVASQTLKPVIGIPCHGAFDGMDAMLSIFQMPPQIPVIGVGVEQTNEASRIANAFLDKKLKKIYLLKPVLESEKLLFNKSKEFLNELKVPFGELELNDEAGKKIDGIILSFVQVSRLNEFNSKINEMKFNGFFLIAPSINSCSASDAKIILDNSKKNCWVGLNNYRNAVIAGIQLINAEGKYDKILESLRKKAGEKVLEDDKKFRK